MVASELTCAWAVLALGAAPLAWSQPVQAATGAKVVHSQLPHIATEVPRLAAAATETPPSRPPRISQANGHRNVSGRKSTNDSDAQVWLVDVTVNGQRLKSLARFERLADGTFLLSAASWAEARLAQVHPPRVLGDGTPAFALNDVTSASWQLNPQTLQLEITAPAKAFVGSMLGMKGALAEPPPRPDPGVLLNYDATAFQSQHSASPHAGLALEAVAFNKFGSLVTSGVVRHNGRQSEAYRLDTFWRYDLPHRMAAVVVGDNVGTSGGWSRPARYAGVRFGRDFSMRPGFVTQPQLTLTGEATLPSTVDILVDNARRSSQPVQPGPFDVTNVPMTSGAGEVNLVVRDLLGRETIVTQSYYLSPHLLAEGLSDYSFEAGWLRRGYGADYSYDKDPFGAITWGQGLSPSLTGEIRLEVQPDRQAAGVDLNGLLGHWAAARVAVATSTRKLEEGGTETGQILKLGLERMAGGRGISLQYERASQGFAPFGEAQVTPFGMANVLGQRPRETIFVGVGGTIVSGLNAGMDYVHRQRWSGETVKVLGGSLSWSVWRKARFQLSLAKRLDDERDWRASISINMPLGNGVNTSSRVERYSDGTTGATVAAQRNRPSGPGLGWNIEAAHQDSLRARGGLQYNTNASEWAADASTGQDGDWALRLSGRGSVGWLAGVPFASRPAGQTSFAVVEVGGVPGVPVKRSNNVVAYTNKDGKAFVPGLLPWQHNQIEIDPVDLPLDIEINEVVKSVTPYPRSGSLVQFDLRRSRQALVTLVQPNGQHVPVGARVRLLPDGPEFITGRRGKVWLSGLARARQTAQVRWNSVGGCSVTLDVPESSDGTPGLLGPLTCGTSSP